MEREDTELFYELPGNEYGDGFEIESYNGQISLAVAQEGKDGVIYKKWAFMQGKGKKAAETAIPVKVTLGNGVAEAITAVEFILRRLREMQADGGGGPVNDKIPF